MRVLIIEDDVMWQCKLQIIAERAGLDIAPIAASLEQAHAYLADKTPDLIIADIHLGDGDIFSLLNNKLYKTIPTILTTASENNQDFLKSKKLSNSAFVVKPFHSHTLLSAIDTLKRNLKDDIRISNAEIRRFYKFIGDDTIISLFGLKETETYILKKRWSELKTFSEIGKDLRLSGQRIQWLYDKTLEKIKQKTFGNVPKYREYLNITKHKKNRLELLKESLELHKGKIKKIELNSSINSLEDLNTKWKNILWDKNIKTIEDLIQYSKKELSLFKKMGPFAVLEIEKALSKHGFELKG